MKVFAFLFPALIAVTITSCQIKEQAEELQALKECTYEIVSADSVFLSNINVTRLIKNNTLDLINAPQLAFSYLQKSMPLSAVVHLKITNPGTQQAGINEFEYRVLIKETQLINGYYDKKISVPASGSTVVPITINQDIYPLISSPQNQSAVTDFLGSTEEKQATVTLKIKPAISIGNELIKYPDYISIDQTFTNKSLMAYLSRLSRNQGTADTVSAGQNTRVSDLISEQF